MFSIFWGSNVKQESIYLDRSEGSVQTLGLGLTEGRHCYNYFLVDLVGTNTDLSGSI